MSVVCFQFFSYLFRMTIERKRTQTMKSNKVLRFIMCEWKNFQQTEKTSFQRLPILKKSHQRRYKIYTHYHIKIINENTNNQTLQIQLIKLN